MQPVRHAVAGLIGDEALEVAPNRAVRVPIMTAAKFDELTAIRMAIEGFAVETAARSRSAVDLASIRRFDRAFRRECRSAAPDAERAVRANQALHFAAYRAARMPALMAIIEGLWLRIGPVLNLDMRASPQRLQMGQAETCHAALLRGLGLGCALPCGDLNSTPRLWMNAAAVRMSFSSAAQAEAASGHAMNSGRAEATRRASWILASTI